MSWNGQGSQKLNQKKIVPADKHVYMMLESNLPIDVMKIRTKEIDTQNDYEKAVEWVKKGYND